MALLASKPFLVCLGLLGPLAAASPAWSAPEPSPSEISVARRLFGEGRSAEEAGRWHEAAEKFRSAIAIKDTPGLRFHLARCEEEQGAFVEALVEYDRARELLDSGVQAADVEKLLPGARERVRAKLALLTLKTPQDAAEVTIELDGRTLSSSVLGQALPMNPGKHRVTAATRGRSRSVELELATGEARQLTLELPDATTTPAGASPPPPASARAPGPSVSSSDSVAPSTGDHGLSARSLVLVGEGAVLVVGLATGIGFTLAKSSADDRSREANAALEQKFGGDPRACTQMPLPEACPALNEAIEDGRRDAALATAGFVTAGVSALALGLTYGLWPEAASKPRVSASATRAGFSLALAGHF